MSAPMTPGRRAEIEKLVADATEGPWNTAAEAGELGFGYSPHFVANWEGEYLHGVGDVITGDGDDAEADLRLILAAPTVIPELLAENARLLREVTVLSFNFEHPVGTPVTVCPGCRPEQHPKARSIKTRTRTAAWLAHGGRPVVMVEDCGSWIALTHVDVTTGGGE